MNSSKQLFMLALSGLFFALNSLRFSCLLCRSVPQSSVSFFGRSPLTCSLDPFVSDLCLLKHTTVPLV